MTRIDDHSYYAMRLKQEHARAARVACDHARRAHLGLAALYAGRLRDAAGADAMRTMDPLVRD